MAAIPRRKFRPALRWEPLLLATLGTGFAMAAAAQGAAERPPDGGSPAQPGIARSGSFDAETVVGLARPLARSPFVHRSRRFPSLWRSCSTISIETFASTPPPAS